MADKQAIVNDIRKNYGNMLNVQQVAKVFNCHRTTVSTFVDGVPYLKVGKEKKYLATDIGNLIYRQLEASS